MKLKKGFKNIEEAVLNLWASNNITEKKIMLIEIINSDLHRATKIKKFQLKDSVNKATTKQKLDQLASNIMMQDSKSTATIKGL